MVENQLGLLLDPAELTDTLEIRVRTSLLDQFYEGVWRLYLMHGLFLIGLCGTYYWKYRNPGILVACAALQVMWYLRCVAARRYQRDANRHLEVAKWERYSVYSVVFSAAAYSIGYQLLFEAEDLSLSIPLTVLYLGVLVAAALGHTPGVGYLAAITLATTVYTLLASGNEACRNTALAVVLIALVCLNVGRAKGKARFQSLRQQYVNEQLVEELAQQVHRATEAEKRANSLSLEKSRFISAASHDLRQPLHAVSLHVTALRYGMDGDPRRHQVDRLCQSVDALNASFNEMLDLSRLDANLMNVELKPVPLSACFSELQARFIERANAKDVVLRFRHSPGVVSADPVLLTRLIGNLVDNAIKFAPGASVMVAARRRNAQRYQWVIEVRDAGPGIPLEHQSTIFEEYFQLANEQRDRSEGSGLGLAIVKRLARLMDMQVSVNSRPGFGTTFSVHCEAARPQAPEAAGPSLAAPAAQPPKDALRNRTILVVDNELEILGAMETLLTQYGAEVKTAGSAARALELMRTVPGISMAVVDYRLGEGGDGMDLAFKLRELSLNEHLPVLVMTGDTSAHLIAALHAAGLPACFKPLNGEELIRQLRSLCG